MKQDIEYAVPLFKAGAEWRINSVWHDAREKPDCYRFIVFLPKKSTIGLKNPIMGILEENRIFISSRPGCILYRLYEMESWAYLDDLLPQNKINNMESEKKKICPKCGCEDGSGQNNIHSMNPEHFCKCPIRSIMERDGVCYSCAFWIRLYEENKNNPNWLIIDGESWIANPFVPNTNNKTRRFMGMGGRMMEAISNDGRKIISNDWWHQGKIPEEFKDLIPDNAKWVK